MITPERPFGIYLYPYFEDLYYSIRGEKVSAFRFLSGLTPLSTSTEGSFSLFFSQLVSKTLLLTLIPSLSFSTVSHPLMYHLLYCHLWWPTRDEKHGTLSP